MSVENFRQAIRDAGIEPPEYINADGQIHTFSTNGKHSDKAGRYIYFDDIHPGGWFKDWRTGMEANWSDTSRKISDEEMEKIRIRRDEINRKRKDDAIQREKTGIEKATAIYSKCSALTDHPYLTKKGVPAYSGLRQLDDKTLIPIRNAEGRIQSLQYINGEKLYMSGGVIRGGFFSIGKPSDTLCIAEGYATAASVHMATGHAVAVAFDSGNLPKVAQVVRKKFPDKEIIICADDDHTNKVNVGMEKAIEAAESISGLVAIPAFPDNRSHDDTDFNDLHRLVDLSAVKECIRKASPPTNIVDFADIALQFQEPISLDTAKYLELEGEYFPAWFSDMAEGVAEATETPLELATMMGIAVVATCVQRKIIVSPSTGYTEPLCIWALVMLESGNRKSAVIKVMTQFLTDEEIKLAEEMADEIRAAEEANVAIDDEIDEIRKLRRKCFKAGKDAEFNVADLTQNIVDLEGKKVPVPVSPEFWAQDVTPEKLGDLMYKQGEKMTLLSAEGGIFDIMSGRYSGGVPNIDIYLQGHASDSVKVHRGSRDDVWMEQPALSMGLSPQPSTLSSLAEQKGFRGRGLLARFLYVLPRSKMGSRTFNSSPVPASIISEYESKMKALMSISMPVDDEGNCVPHVLKFSDEALHEWKAFALVLEPGLAEGGRYDFMKDWVGKFPGAAVRLAGFIHCMEYADSDPWRITVDVDTLKKSLNLCAVLLNHAMAAFDMMGSDEALNGARKVWLWIRRNREPEFKARDCFDSLKGTFKRMAVIDPAFDVLMERHYILEKPQQKRRGRPSREFIVNPLITEKWK